MTPNSAYTLVPIVVGTDYTPGVLTGEHGGPGGPVVVLGKTPPIYALLCTKSTGTGVVVLKALGNDVDVNIPTETFKVGVVYYIYLKELIDDDGNGVEFIGYQYQSHPFAF